MSRKSAMTVALVLLVNALSLGAISGAVLAEQAAAPAAAEKKPMVWALISAVGDQFTYVRQKQTVGSNIIDNNVRQTVSVPNEAVNIAVLRGLDKAIEQRDPGSTRILAKLRAVELEGVLPQDREKVAMEKLTQALQDFPGRMTWDRIILVTPKFQMSERKGMGSKLQGIGIYVQPLERGNLDGIADFGADFSDAAEEETVTPDGKRGERSSRYVAPYNYTKTWILDAKTLKVIETSARYEYQKIYDPLSTSRNVEGHLTTEQLAKLLSTFIERSTARSVGELLPQITIGEVVPVAAKPDEPKK